MTKMCDNHPNRNASPPFRFCRSCLDDLEAGYCHTDYSPNHLEDVSIVTDSSGTDLEIYYSGNPGYLIVSIVGVSEVASIDMDADALEKVARRFLNEAARIRGDKKPLILRRFEEII